MFKNNGIIGFIKGFTAYFALSVILAFVGVKDWIFRSIIACLIILVISIIVYFAKKSSKN